MALALSAEQEDALNRIVLPPGWNGTNPPMTAAPLPFFNSYASPAWGIRTTSPITDQPEKSNQFNSALTQPKGASTVWNYLADGKQGGGCAGGCTGGALMLPRQDWITPNSNWVTKPDKTRVFKTQPKIQVGVGRGARGNIPSAERGGKKIIHM